MVGFLILKISQFERLKELIAQVDKCLPMLPRTLCYTWYTTYIKGRPCYQGYLAIRGIQRISKDAQVTKDTLLYVVYNVYQRTPRLPRIP